MRWRGVLGALAVTLGCLGSAGAVEVTATAGDGSAAVPGPASVGLGAVATDAPEPNDELQVVSTTWSWGTVSVEDLTEAAPGTCLAPVLVDGTISQPNPELPSATLDVSATRAGTYRVTLAVSVTYKMSDGSEVTGGAETQCTVTFT